MKRFLNTIVGGVLSGVLGTFFGFLILGAYWSYSNNVDLNYFIENIAAKSLLYRDSMLTQSTLFNVAGFHIVIKSKWWNFCLRLLNVIFSCRRPFLSFRYSVRIFF